MWQQLYNNLQQGNVRALARTISLVENGHAGHFEFLQQLPQSDTPVIGITGAPGAGKSTLTDALIGELTSAGHHVGVLCVDPSSPFNLGALLGDRIRMSRWYHHPQVFIRSLASRGSLGGLHPKIIELTDVMKAAPFDYIIVETVGVGQSEVEIAGLADVSIVLLVPEGGDEVQTMKAGLMEIADLFVVNKADRPDADTFVNNLKMMLAPAMKHHRQVPILKTVATRNEGIADVWKAAQHQLQYGTNPRKSWLLAEKAYHLVQQYKMREIDKSELKTAIEAQKDNNGFNLYSFAARYF